MIFLNVFNSPIFIILIVFVIITIITIVSSLKPSPSIIRKNIETILKNSNIDYTINETSDKSYSFTLLTKNKQFAVLVLPIEKFAEITINNFNTWEMHFGAGEKPGKSQPYKTRIAQIPNFMNLETSLEKLVLIQPNAKQLVVWKNENEIVDIKPTEKVYGIYVMNATDLPKLLNNNYETKQ